MKVIALIDILVALFVGVVRANGSALQCSCSVDGESSSKFCHFTTNQTVKLECGLLNLEHETQDTGQTVHGYLEGVPIANWTKLPDNDQSGVRYVTEVITNESHYRGVEFSCVHSRDSCSVDLYHKANVTKLEVGKILVFLRKPGFVSDLDTCDLDERRRESELIWINELGEQITTDKHLTTKLYFSQMLICTERVGEEYTNVKKLFVQVFKLVVSRGNGSVVVFSGVTLAVQFGEVLNLEWQAVTRPGFTRTVKDYDMVYSIEGPRGNRTVVRESSRITVSSEQDYGVYVAEVRPGSHADNNGKTLGNKKVDSVVIRFAIVEANNVSSQKLRLVVIMVVSCLLIAFGAVPVVLFLMYFKRNREESARRQRRCESVSKVSVAPPAYYTVVSVDRSGSKTNQQLTEIY